MRYVSKLTSGFLYNFNVAFLWEMSHALSNSARQAADMDQATLRNVTILAVILAVSGAGPQIVDSLKNTPLHTGSRLDALERRVRRLEEMHRGSEHSPVETPDRRAHARAHGHTHRPARVVLGIRN